MTTFSQPSFANTREILEKTFGFKTFRANQEAVCNAAISGKDVLLVMPTGSGKSLCYQLPALVRGGTALVVSPLIALMEDQIAKLAALGLRVARIHSGLDRAASREACRDYLDGRLQFFFIAPERLRVPGFGRMLARRKPNLIAIDEAHCISQWGHDFRPDYRMLRQHLALLRPAPVMALTATATPVVQNDIIEQLGFTDAARFIHGFRRDNLAIEAVEVSHPRRTQFAREILSNRERRPAIVYAPTRKDAEQTAGELAGTCPSAAYHAGLDSGTRERIQRQFISGQLEVVVATIAFGMGIDKADVRTVIHTALPGSLEGFYQEIGRAGRDGKASRTVLMHSYADRRTHDFFYQRDYPEMAILDRIYRSLGASSRQADELRNALQLDSEVFSKALDKLAANGGAIVDFEGRVTAGGREWRSPYAMQSAFRQAQVEKVMLFAEGSRCRMSALIEHFGDVQDTDRRCGLCDFCAPQDAIAQVFRPLTGEEQQTVFAIARALRTVMGMSTGKLHRQLFPRDQLSRDEFETLLVAMARGSYIIFEDAEFESEGRTIAYRKVSLTDEGEELSSTTALRLFVPEARSPEPPKHRSEKSGSGKKAERIPQRKTASDDTEESLTPSELELEMKLKAWRLDEARKNGFAAFVILSNKTLRSIVRERPSTVEDLLRVPGIGPGKAARFGESICAICADT
ncbi:MAG TPA: ATP-dependent DNA helicase RecQ [Silvibacterium sp.]|nr:ATP-dependent DNA helicase RecQ [Silvibacterium sp.]